MVRSPLLLDCHLSYFLLVSERSPVNMILISSNVHSIKGKLKLVKITRFDLSEMPSVP